MRLHWVYYYSIDELDARVEYYKQELEALWYQFLLLFKRLIILPRIFLRLSYWVIFSFFIKGITLFKVFTLILFYLFIYRFLFHSRAIQAPELDDREQYTFLWAYWAYKVTYFYFFIAFTTLTLQYTPLFSCWWELGPRYLGFSVFEFIPFSFFLWYLKLILLNPFTIVVYYACVSSRVYKIKLSAMHTTFSLSIVAYMFFYFMLFLFWGYIFSWVLVVPLIFLLIYILGWYLHLLNSLSFLWRKVTTDSTFKKQWAFQYKKKQALFSEDDFIWKIRFSKTKEEEAEHEKLIQEFIKQQKEKIRLRKRALGVIDPPKDPTVREMMQHQAEVRALQEELAQIELQKQQKLRKAYRCIFDRALAQWRYTKILVKSKQGSGLSLSEQIVYTEFKDIYKQDKEEEMRFTLRFKHCFNLVQYLIDLIIFQMYLAYYTVRYNVLSIYRYLYKKYLRATAFHYYHLARIFSIVRWPYQVILYIEAILYEEIRYKWLTTMNLVSYIAADSWPLAYSRGHRTRVKVSLKAFIVFFGLYFSLSIFLGYVSLYIYMNIADAYYILYLYTWLSTKAIYEAVFIETQNQWLIPFTWSFLHEMDTGLCSFLEYFLDSLDLVEELDTGFSSLAMFFLKNIELVMVYL